MTGPENSRLDDVAQFMVSGKAGDYIFEEGDTGTDMFIIQEGEVEILKLSGSQMHRLALLEAGDFFGEMSLLEELPRDLAIGELELVEERSNPGGSVLDTHHAQVREARERTLTDQRGDRVFQMAGFRGTDDRRADLRLAQHPGERHPGRRLAQLFRRVTHAGDNRRHRRDDVWRAS